MNIIVLLFNFKFKFKDYNIKLNIMDSKKVVLVFGGAREGAKLGRAFPRPFFHGVFVFFWCNCGELEVLATKG